MGGTFAERFAGESLDVLEAILEHSRDCIKLVNMRGELEYLSPSAQAAMGVGDISKLVGRIWRDLWPESERPALDRAVAGAVAGSSTRFDGITYADDGTKRHWEVAISPVRGPGGGATHLLIVSSEITNQMASAERGRRRWERAEDRADLAGVVSRELRHRLKNQLAVVNAVAKLLARHSLSARELAVKLEEKLIAIGRAQDLISVERDGPLMAGPALAEVLGASGAGDRVKLREMPAVPLPDESIQQLALLLGELQTNALKHGALRTEAGQVQLSGAMDGELLTLRWQEDCGSPVVPVDGGNGGFQLIRRLGAAGGKRPAIDWQPNGIVVDFHVRVAS